MNDPSSHDHAPPPPASAGVDSLLEQMVASAIGPLSRLRDTIDCSLEQVCEWMNQPANRHQISNLVTLLDAQTQLLICQHRLLAVARLVEVAGSPAPPETIRRACADLLRIKLFDPYREDKRPVRLPPPRPINEQAILQALEALGEADEADDAPKDAPRPPEFLTIPLGPQRMRAQPNTCPP